MDVPTILDVNADPQGRDWEADFLSRLELHVTTCAGPRREGACPLLHGKPCGRVRKADGILFQLDLDVEDHRKILQRYAEMLDIPIRAVVTQDQKERYADLLADVEVETGPVGPAKLDAFAAEVEHS